MVTCWVLEIRGKVRGWNWSCVFAPHPLQALTAARTKMAGASSCACPTEIPDNVAVLPASLSTTTRPVAEVRANWTRKSNRSEVESLQQKSVVTRMQNVRFVGLSKSVCEQQKHILIYFAPESPKEMWSGKSPAEICSYQEVNVNRKRTVCWIIKVSLRTAKASVDPFWIRKSNRSEVESPQQKYVLTKN